MINVFVDGELVPFSSLQIEESILFLANEASLVTHSDAADIFDPVQIFHNTDLIFRGYIREKETERSDGGTVAKYRIASESSDLVECSHEGPLQYKNAKTSEILNSVLKPTQVPYEIDLGRERTHKITFALDATPAEILRNLSEEKTILFFTQRNGVFLVTDKSPEVSSVPLPDSFTSERIQEGGAVLFSSYSAKGSDEKEQRKVSSVPRHRPLKVSGSWDDPKEKISDMFHESAVKSYKETRVYPGFLPVEIYTKTSGGLMITAVNFNFGQDGTSTTVEVSRLKNLAERGAAKLTKKKQKHNDLLGWGKAADDDANREDLGDWK